MFELPLTEPVKLTAPTWSAFCVGGEALNDTLGGLSTTLIVVLPEPDSP